MATEQLMAWNTITKPANADLSSNQFYAVDINSSGKIVVASAAGQRVLGILQNKPTANQGAGVAVGGVSKAVAAAAITAGALLTTAADGRLQTATSGQFVVGRAVSAAGAANQLVEILLLPGSAAVP